MTEEEYARLCEDVVLEQHRRGVGGPVGWLFVAFFALLSTLAWMKHQEIDTWIPMELR